ncbi:pilS cassette, partial [Neisseria meningitidis]|nr:pilS cassette [Neisseria meningitidis]
PVIPTKVGIQFFEFQSFPINCLSIECLDSRLRGMTAERFLLLPINVAISNPVIPTKVGIRFVRFHLF